MEAQHLHSGTQMGKQTHQVPDTTGCSHSQRMVHISVPFSMGSKLDTRHTTALSQEVCPMYSHRQFQGRRVRQGFLSSYTLWSSPMILQALKLWFIYRVVAKTPISFSRNPGNRTVHVSKYFKWISREYLWEDNLPIYTFLKYIPLNWKFLYSCFSRVIYRIAKFQNGFGSKRP